MSVTIGGEQRIRLVDDARVHVSEAARVRVLAGDVVYINEGGGVALPIDIADVDGLQDELDALAGSGGGGRTLHGAYVNIVAEVADGTHDATIAYLTSNPAGSPAGFRLYVFDGTDATIVQSVGPSDPYELNDFQPIEEAMFVSHIFIDQAQNPIAGQRIWYTGADSGVGAPHSYVVDGVTRELGGADVALSLRDVAFVTLTGDRSFALPDGSFRDESASWLDLIVLETNGHTLTLSGTVGGETDPTITGAGWYRVWATGSTLEWGPRGQAGGGGLTAADNDYIWFNVNAFPAADGAETLSFDRRFNVVTLTGDASFAFLPFSSGAFADAAEMIVEVSGAFSPTFDATFPGGTPAYSDPSVYRFWSADGGGTVWGERVGAGGGTGDVVGPASATDGAPVLFDGAGGKLVKAGATNAANGLAKLDGDGTIPDILIPSTIARDSEVTSAVGTHEGAADPHTGYVLKSLFDAQTILAATSDNTPAALTVGEQSLVGRITGGNIAALTASQVRTLLGLVIGTDVQAYDSDLASIAALATTAFGRARLVEASGWVPVSDTTVSNSGSGVASISVSCSGYRFLRVRFKGRSLKSSTTTDTLNLTFSSDSTSKYGKNTGALQTAYAVSTAYTASNTNTDRMGDTTIEIACGNSSWTTFRVFNTVMPSTNTVGTATDFQNGVYVATTAVTSLQLAFAGGNIADGSSLIVEGWA